MRKLVIGIVLFLQIAAAGLAKAEEAPAKAVKDGPRESTDPLSLGLPASDLPTPEEGLGYPLGSRFTQYHQILDYLETLAESSDRIVSWKYGESYEGRPLGLLAISSRANIRRLEEIRQRQLRLANASFSAENVAEILEKAPAIVWLAYGVHGNESSSAEVAMATVYALAAAQGQDEEMLKDLVVLVDPLVNPDGRERYVQGFLQRRGARPDSLRAALEHQEPWPGGRFNHYLNDLNRDWAWATQVETRARLAAYRKWEPQVYVDFHEMGSDSTYFFPPAAEPILPAIDPQTVRWLETFGRNNAREFDLQGWPYYKAENFDLFYPGYGDSYPSLRAAVGMTYEVAGGGFGGQLVQRKDGSELSLSDRIARHFTTSMTTVRVAAKNRRALLEDFSAIRRRSMNTRVQTFVWEATDGEAQSMAELLALHGIQVRRLRQPVTMKVQEISSSESQQRELPAGAYAVSTAQSLGSLARTLLEAEAEMSASFVKRQRERLEQKLHTEFYDITSWSLPLAFDVRTWVVDGEIQGAVEQDLQAGSEITGQGSLGFMVPPQGLGGYRLASALQEAGLAYRLALRALEAEDRTFPSGTLFIPSAGNPAETLTWVEAKARALGVRAHRLSSSYSSSGLSLGSNEFIPIRAPRIGLASGDGVRPNDHGSLWNLLDQILELPSSRIDLPVLGSRDLRHFDVLILPSGSGYSRRLDEDDASELRRWVKDGGFLIAIGQAATWLADQEISSLRIWGEEDAEEGSEEREWSLDTAKISTPGAALATVLSPLHPLAVGLERPPTVLAVGDQVFLPFGNPRRDLLRARDSDPVLAGLAWEEAEQRLAGSLLVGVEPVGEGAILLFAQDPAFRLFWRATMPLLLNGVLHGPSLGDAGFLDD